MPWFRKRARSRNGLPSGGMANPAGMTLDNSDAESGTDGCLLSADEKRLNAWAPTSTNRLGGRASQESAKARGGIVNHDSADSTVGSTVAQATSDRRAAPEI